MRGVEATPDGTFRARIKYQGKNVSLGVFLDAGIAEAVYLAAVERRRQGLPPVEGKPIGPLTEIEAFRATYDYDTHTGEFWHRCKRSGLRTGRKAGGLGNHGYLSIWLGSRLYLAHRVAWLLHAGRWPESQIDHINMVKTDNRLENLREATPAQQMMNRRVRRETNTGTKGVFLRHKHHKRIKKYAAKIKVANEVIPLGNFATTEEAAAAYADAANRYFGEFARPN